MTRDGAIDGVRGVAVLAMIVVHCFAFFAAAGTQADTAGVVLDIGKLTAVFILCMGVSSAFARRRAPRDLVRRGLQLLLYGYGLNLLKFVVPLVVFRNLPEALTIDLGWEVGTTATLWKYAFLGDILHLVGLSLLVLAGLRALGAGPGHHLALGAVVALFAPAVWGLRGGGPVLTYACDLLFSEGFTVFFPLFPWLAYTLFGFALGEWLQRSPLAPAAAYARWSRVGVLLIAASVIAGVLYPPAWKGWDFYRTGPAGVAAVTGFTMVAFRISHLVWTRAPRWLQGLWGHCSRRVTRLYVISWVTICWLMGWVGFMQHDGVALVGLTAAVFAITFALERVWHQRDEHRHRDAQRQPELPAAWSQEG